MTSHAGESTLHQQRARPDTQPTELRPQPYLPLSLFCRFNNMHMLKKTPGNNFFHQYSLTQYSRQTTLILHPNNTVTLHLCSPESISVPSRHSIPTVVIGDREHNDLEHPPKNQTTAVAGP